MSDEMPDTNGPIERNGAAPIEPARAAGDEAARSTVDPPSTRKPPLISAIEIENFKGIGAPARIELRPITLLFGQNSAGKSTVLHALCYAHELLSHRNVDAHRTELGGDRIDLGGFRQLLYRHDPERTLRLRFELNLKNWCVPDHLLEEMVHPALSEYVDPGDAEDHKNWVLKHARGELARTGWVEVHVGIRSGTGTRWSLYMRLASTKRSLAGSFHSKAATSWSSIGRIRCSLHFTARHRSDRPRPSVNRLVTFSAIVAKSSIARR